MSHTGEGVIFQSQTRAASHAALFAMVLTGAAAPACADADLTLNTRFIQGSFDLLLPDGWVAALTAEGMAMEVQSPERHKLTLNARVRNENDLARAQEYHLEQLRGAAYSILSALMNSDFSTAACKLPSLILDSAKRAGWGDTSSPRTFRCTS